MKATALALAFCLLLACASRTSAQVIVDDTWADGIRTDTNLPDESAWYESSSGSLAVVPGTMTGTPASGSNRTWWTYFTNSPGSPVQLAIGETLRARVTFTPAGVDASNTARGFQVGFYDFSGGTRSTGSGSPNGTNVRGYLLNLNFAEMFGINDPLQLRERTNLGSSALMSTTSDYTTLSAGGGTLGQPAFVSGSEYTLELTATRTGAGLQLSATVTGPGGWTATHTTTASTIVDRFDGLAIRTTKATETATSFAFTRFRVERVASGPSPPSIVSQPQSQTVTVGQGATFTVSATGTAPLSYQWFRDGQIVSGETGASLTLSNLQLSDSGSSFSATVTNAHGSATSNAATLTVVGLTPPSILTPPHSQTVSVGQGVIFSVAATGSPTLTYQWFKGGVAIPGATASSLALSTVQYADAGSYHVSVTNGAGTVASPAATLTVTAFQPTTVPSFALAGFAALDGFSNNGTWQPGGTTGGTGGAHVQVTTVAQLVTYLESTTPYVVEIMNDLDLSTLANHSGGFPGSYPTGEILVRSHKTIFSKNGSTIRRGTLRIGKASLGPQKNVIIRNLRFRDLWVLDPSGDYDSYGWDYIHLEEGSHHVWVDHCDFEKVYDGMIDMTHAVDFVTVSWCVFRTQKKCHLIGHSDSNRSEDTGHLNVTFHHNHYLDVEERMPRMRFGNAHVFNLYCENLGGNGIQSTASAATLVENSYFLHPEESSLPTRQENGGLSGTIKVMGSVIVNLPGESVAFRESYPQTGFSFNAPFASATPPYPYALHAATDVPIVVPQYAGVGKLGFIFWQQDNFTATELANPALSGTEAVLTSDGASNLLKYALGVPAWSPLPPMAAPALEYAAGGGTVFRYRRAQHTSDIGCAAEVSTDLTVWSRTNVVSQLVATSGGIETWEARYIGPATPRLFFRLAVQR